MNLFVHIQTLLKLALALLLGLLPFHHALAQEAGQQKRNMHIKMIRTVDGKTVVVDTTFAAETEEAIAKALKAARLDTGHMRLLDEKIRAYTLGKEGEAMLKARVHSLKADSAMRRAMKEVRVLSLSADSMSKEMMKRMEALQGEMKHMGITLEGHPQIHIRSLSDSSHTFTWKDGERIMAINPKEIERIIVESMPRGLITDSLLSKEGKAYVKILKGGENRKVYRIDRDGNKRELIDEEIDLQLARDGHAIFIVRKAKVEDVTKADKEQLKATGAPVEMKSREELKVEEINFSPNPNSGRFNLKFSLKNKGTTVVRVMDDKGQEVFVDTVEKLSGTYEREIDLTPFGRGLYFLQVAQGDRYHTKKILVQ
ncbi:T9SS type A sorting domain-containing protein [Pontibacter ramchanderi]|uniref:Putative secreted protein (Por secretion system target) n=1 Tax=Pontibacter ramchanderi TaxID=1179743 RepID=A0A2N3V3H8_9BACT|nr:T9SS type A sorting domain-containing protein [Pontibacter ramchanderi]PKV76185.1 putative secreted protein (Por secretion system target) [Pontibacter ramchanderi]